jgi:hypothetical protein
MTSSGVVYLAAWVNYEVLSSLLMKISGVWFVVEPYHSWKQTEDES